MARQIEFCIGEVTTAGPGRQLGDRCNNRGYTLQHHLCHRHQGQHNNPNYPTSESYRLRSNEGPDHTPQMEVQRDTSRAGPSNREIPVNNPARTTANDEPSQQNLPQRQPASISRSDERGEPTPQTEVQRNTSQAGRSTRQRPVLNPSRNTANNESWPSTAPQRRPATFRPQLSTIFEPSQLDSPQREPASSRSQLPTPPEQPDRRRYATPEPMTSPNRTPTQTSNTVIAPIKRLLPQYTPTPQGVSKESNQIRFRRPPSLPHTPASGSVNGVLPKSRREQSGISQPSPSTADRSLLTQNTPAPQIIRRESSEIRYPRLRSTPASPTVPPRSRPEQSRIPQPSPSAADRSLPTQNALPPPVMRRESSANRSPGLYNLPPMPASQDLNDIRSRFEPEQRGVSEPSPSTADRSLSTQNTLSPPIMRRESSEGQHSGLYNLPLTPASSIVSNIHPRVERAQNSITEPNSSLADRSLPIQDSLNSPVVRRGSTRAESSANHSPGLYNLPPMPASPDLNIVPRFEPEQRGVSEPSPSSADSNNEQNETESQPQRTHRHNSTNTSEHSSIAGSSSTNSTPRSSPPPLTPQARSILRQRSRLLKNLSEGLIDAGVITSDDRLRAVISEQTSVPGASSILDIIVDMLQGYMGLRYIDEIPKGLAAKLLRAACEDGEEGERFAESLRQWMVRRGGAVDEDIVEAFGLDEFEDWTRVGEPWMTRLWGFLGSWGGLRKEKRE